PGLAGGALPAVRRLASPVRRAAVLDVRRVLHPVRSADASRRRLSLDAGGAVSAVVTGSVTVVGAGDIGTHLLPHLARMWGVRRVTVIDRDRYEEKNLTSQNITRRDVGKRKAMVQASRLRRINP